MSRSAVVLCPGRGSYTASELGYLAQNRSANHAELFDALEGVDAARAAGDDLKLLDIDGASAFDPAFFRGENASGLTFACTAFDFLRLDESLVDIVAVGGNSMGWYSALFCAGAMPLTRSFKLVETMGGAVRDGQIGAQVLYPIVDDDWRVQASHVEAVETALAAGHDAGWSIRYGGFAVLWVTSAGLPALFEALPERTQAGRKYPMELPGHSAFHSPLLRDVAEDGYEKLRDLPWSAPEIPLIDGRGHQWSPFHADPDALARYTLGHQVTETFDFSATVQVALREYAPELLVLLGPGDSLGAAVAQVLIAEGWQGINCREAFLQRQREDPLVVALGRPEQARLVVQTSE